MSQCSLISPQKILINVVLHSTLLIAASLAAVAFVTHDLWWMAWMVFIPSILLTFWLYRHLRMALSLQQSSSQSTQPPAQQLLESSIQSPQQLQQLELQLKKVKRRVQQSDALQTLLLHHAGQGVFGVALDGCVNFTNPAAENIIGFTAKEMDGKKMHPIIHHHHRNGDIYCEDDCHLYLTLKDGITRHISHEVFWHADGTPVDVDYVVAAVKEEERITGAVVVFSDITEERKHQELLRQSKQRLRDLVAHREQAREEERAHIAREIHDELGQQLTALRMDTTLLRLQYAEIPPALDAHIQRMKDAIDNCIVSVRQVASSLRPAVLDVGLNTAVDWLLKRVEIRPGITTVFIPPAEELVLDDARATAVFRVLQESLTNITRHAEATRIEVCLRCENNILEVTVADNGKGFDSQVVRNKRGFGLMGIRERVLIFGGRVRFDSALGQGTTVRLFIPLTDLSPETSTSH